MRKPREDRQFWHVRKKSMSRKSSGHITPISIVIGTATGLALIPGCRAPSQPESVNLTSNEERCLAGGQLCYSNLLDTIKLADDSGALTDF